MLIHDKAIKTLKPADYLAIEEDHAQLEKFLNELRDSCAVLDKLDQVNDHEKLASYRGRLSSCLLYISELVTKHFDTEETIMLSRPHVTEEYEYFRKHRQAHADILRKLDALVNECFTFEDHISTVEIYHQFYDRLSALFDEHDRTFDDPFMQSTKA
jgi:hemerythrin